MTFPCTCILTVKTHGCKQRKYMQEFIHILTF